MVADPIYPATNYLLQTTNYSAFFYQGETLVEKRIKDLDRSTIYVLCYKLHQIVNTGFSASA